MVLEAVVAVAETQFGGRDGKLRAVGANAHVTAQRQPDTASDAIPADHCDGRLGKCVEGIVGVIDRCVVAVDAFLG